MKELCEECNVCSFMPKQTKQRLYALDNEERHLEVLVIDDARRHAEMKDCLDTAHEILDGVDFTYTTTIRCEHRLSQITQEQEQDALSRCAVWTHALVDKRLVILTTLKGLAQMKTTRERTVGESFKSSRYGYILVIPPLAEIDSNSIREYHSRAQRLLKEAGLK